MSPRWNDEPGEALRAVRPVVKEEEEEEEEDTKTSSALPKREEIIERFGLFGTPRRSNDSGRRRREQEVRDGVHYRHVFEWKDVYSVRPMETFRGR